jgi:hypothetical protein
MVHNPSFTNSQQQHRGFMLVTCFHNFLQPKYTSLHQNTSLHIPILMTMTLMRMTMVTVGLQIPCMDG